MSFSTGWRAVVERLERWPRAARWGALGLAIVPAGLIGVLLLPGAVRDAVAERAERRGLTAEVGSVRLGLGRIWLGDVEVRDPSLPGTRARVQAVELELSARGVSAVRVHGARIELEGSSEEIAARFRSLSAKSSEPFEAGGGPGRRRSFELRGVDLVWSRRGPSTVIAWGLGLRDDGEQPLRFTVDRLRVEGEDLGAEIVGGEVDLAPGAPRRVLRAEAAQLGARLKVGDGGAAAAPGGVAGPSKASSARSGTVGATSPARPPAALGAAWTALRGAFARLTAESFRGAVVAFSVDVTHASEALRIGPSRLSVTRGGGRLSVEVLPQAAATEGGTPLRLGANIPLEAGPSELELSGGPVRLSALGVREGDFGLVGVREARLDAEARLELDATGSEVKLTSRGRLGNARIFRPALASQELSGIELGWRLSGSARLDGTRVVLDDGELSLGQVRALAHGEFERSIERTRVALHVKVPLASCSAFFEALPRGAAPLLSGVRLGGTFTLAADVEYDSAKPDATSARVVATNECRVAEVPASIAPARFRKAWLREVKGADGAPVAIESGPGTPDWTPYEDISPHMETAVIVCEDKGFFLHRGFAYHAIESSIRQNLVAGRFLRGASTVSMQLAKNLYLGKEKTLSRKLQEAVLTLLLEQELSKHELMELYLNVIEFGPGIYGIRQAARHYFNEEPRSLSLGQALYLASILPSPDSHHFTANGEVSQGWTRYLRKLMQIAHEIRRITDDELAQGLEEQVAFRKPNASADGAAPFAGGEAVDAGEEEPEMPVAPELAP